jgi:GAF domain-containing protein
VTDVLRPGEPVLVDGAAVLPLRLRDETVGALTFASAAQPPEPGSAALAFASELAAECAAAIDKARLDAELRASEDAVRRSNAQLGAILGGVADGVIARDAAGRVV